MLPTYHLDGSDQEKQSPPQFIDDKEAYSDPDASDSEYSVRSVNSDRSLRSDETGYVEHLQRKSEEAVVLSSVECVCSWVGFFSIFTLIGGVITINLPASKNVDGKENWSDALKYVGAALLWLSTFFWINTVMCGIVYWHKYKKKPKKPRPFGYVFLISLLPLGIAMYTFMLLIGFTTVSKVLYCYLVLFGGLVLAILPVFYSNRIARGL